MTEHNYSADLRLHESAPTGEVLAADPPPDRSGASPSEADAHLVESVIAIARHCARTTHWVVGPNGPRHVKAPLRRHHIEGHCNGGRRIGVAPIPPGTSTTKILVCDGDSHKGEVSWDDMIRVARELSSALAQRGVVVIPFRSSGGKGWHLICLWENGQDAFSVRELARQAIESIGFKVGTKGVGKKEIEIFPKSDSTAAEDFGAMFVLPLGGESLPLDPETFEILGYEYAEAATWPHSQPVPVVERQAPTPLNTPDVAANASLAGLRSALAAIPNEGEHELDYDRWRDVLFGIHHATDGSGAGLALAHEFSSRASKYDPDFLDHNFWPYVRSDREGKVITAATVFDMARENGWQEHSTECEFDVVESDTAAGKHATVRFSWMTTAEFIACLPPDWIIKNVLPRAELVVIIGQSGDGKSFLVLDLVAAVARGIDWRGRKVKKGRVGIIAAEGASGYRNRVVAYCRHAGIEPEALDLVVMAAAPNFLNGQDVKDLIAETRKLGHLDLLVIDTLAQVTPGGNENSSEDFGKALAHCKALRQATGATVVLVHHVGKDASRGARGWSGLELRPMQRSRYLVTVTTASLR